MSTATDETRLHVVPVYGETLEQYWDRVRDAGEDDGRRVDSYDVTEHERCGYCEGEGNVLQISPIPKSVPCRCSDSPLPGWVPVDCDWCVVAHVEHPNRPCPRCGGECHKTTRITAERHREIVMVALNFFIGVADPDADVKGLRGIPVSLIDAAASLAIAEAGY